MLMCSFLLYLFLLAPQNVWQYTLVEPEVDNGGSYVS